MGRSLVAIGIFFLAIGVLLVLAGYFWPVLARLGLGHLPGDIVLKRRHFRVYFPLGTSLLVSVVLCLAVSLFFWLFRR